MTKVNSFLEYIFAQKCLQSTVLQVTHLKHEQHFIRNRGKYYNFAFYNNHTRLQDISL